MKTLRYITLLLVIPAILPAQGLRNNGARIVLANGIHLVIQGDYINQEGGLLHQDGTVWLTGNWTNNSTGNAIDSPDGSHSVRFNGTATQTINGTYTGVHTFEGVAVEAGATLEVPGGKQLTLEGGLIVGGTLHLKSDTGKGLASLIVKGTQSGAGEVRYDRYVPAGAFEYISSPLAGQKANVFGNLSETGLFAFSNAGNNWVRQSDGNMDIETMQGFAYISDEAVTITFSGDGLHGGSQSITLDRNDEATGFNLVGNPYSSAIDWTDDGSWIRTNVESSIWINVADEPLAANFATYNSTSGVNTNWTDFVGTDEGIIPPTQAFWVNAEADKAILQVLPGAQVHSGNLLHKKSAATTVNPLLRLKAEKGGYTDEMVIFFHENAIEGYDRYDTRKKMGGGSYPQLYTSIQGDDLAVNALPFEMLEEGLVIPLTLRSPAQGNYTISLTELGGFDVFTGILLADRQKDITVSLRESPVYNFDLAATGDVNGRFELIIGDYTVTGVGELSAPEVRIYSHGRLVYISGAGIGDRWEILNMLGMRLLEGQTEVDGTSVIGTSLPAGIYMVVLHTPEGRVVKRVYID